MNLVSKILLSSLLTMGVNKLFAIEVKASVNKDTITLTYINNSDGSIFISDPGKYGVSLIKEVGGVSLGTRCLEPQNKYLIYLNKRNIEVGNVKWSYSVSFKSEEISKLNLNSLKIAVWMNEHSNVVKHPIGAVIMNRHIIDVKPESENLNRSK